MPSVLKIIQNRFRQQHVRAAPGLRRQSNMTRAEDAVHEDPAIGSFLALLETDIRNGRNLSRLPDDLVQAMLATLTQSVDLAAEMEGDVAL